MMILGDFTDEASVFAEFEVPDADRAGASILLAEYRYENYEGSAFVLFERDGQWFEVNGSHCSCYGLEGQWSPESTTKADLRFRLDEGKGFQCDFSAEFCAELRRLTEAA